MRVIDLDEAIERFIQAGRNISKDQVIYMLNRIPTTEIVKCKDCKWWKWIEWAKEYRCTVRTTAFNTRADGFCSRGERSEE